MVDTEKDGLANVGIAVAAYAKYEYLRSVRTR